MTRRLVAAAAAFSLLTAFGAEALAAPIPLPEVLYYKFNEGSGTTTANYAAPGQGSNPATLNGLTMGGTGFDGTALLGNGGSSTTNYLNTGWSTTLGTGDWTIALWISPVSTNYGPLYYQFGDPTAGAFRMFTNGVAGPNNFILRANGMTDTYVSGASTTANNHLAWVYSSSDHVIRSYLNGVLNSTVAQGALNINGSGNAFKVGGYAASGGIHNGGWIDEFQVYSRALSGADVTEAMNANFAVSGVPEPSTYLMIGIGLTVAAWKRRQG